MVKISVIVPVYNVEKYLRECLDSLINQTLTDIEIICINDGSTDNSLEILKEYAKKDDRIKVINQENKGLGATRNIGINIAKGDYISFIDSDDFLELTTYEKTYEICAEKNLDMIMFKLINYDDEEDRYYTSKYYEMKKIESIVNDNVFDYKDLGDAIFNIAVSACNKLYNRNFIIQNNFKFPKNIAFEDNYFFWNVLLSAKRIYFCKEHLYKRRRHLNSIIGKKGKNHIDTIKINNLIFQIFLNNNIFNKYNSKLYNRKIQIIYSRYINIKYEYKELFFEEMKKDFIKILNHEKYPDFINNLNNINKQIFESVLYYKNWEDFEIIVKNIELKNKIKQLNKEKKSLRDSNKILLNSKSWKITKPLRSIRN